MHNLCCFTSGERTTTRVHLALPNQPNARHLGEQKIKPHVVEDAEAQRKKVQRPWHSQPGKVIWPEFSYH